MKNTFQFITANEMRNKLNNAHFDYTWVFSNGVPDELSESRFRQYLKRIFLSNDSGMHKFNAGSNLNSQKKSNYIKPKRKWILFEQLQIL